MASKISELSPRAILKLDLAGALLSALLLLGLVLNLESFFGIPRNAIIILISFPLAFALYDGIVLAIKPVRYRTYILIIAILNLSYCFVSINVAFSHSSVIKPAGWVYIILEVLVVIGIAILELSIAKRL